MESFLYDSGYCIKVLKNKKEPSLGSLFNRARITRVAIITIIKVMVKRQEPVSNAFRNGYSPAYIFLY
ncbi:hypothetical protein DX931_24440 [Bacillus cereus]|nr:hypothetical protein DX931_24440 [Bacillus cereus]